MYRLRRLPVDRAGEFRPERRKRLHLSSEEGGYAFVAKQPANEEEEQLCQEAVENCPVEAIGDDGNS